MNTLLNKLEVAALLRVSWRTVDRLRKKGLPYIQIGRQIRFSEEEIRKWMRRNQDGMDE